MAKRKIVFQGEPGANSHIACLDVYPKFEPLPAATFEDCFTAVTRGDAELAMIPIENSLAGRVADIHHFLPTSNLHIIGEYFLPIHFQLMALPGVKLSEIRSVHSHVHALGQCRNIIRKHGWKAVVEGDTAGAARAIGETGDRTTAALAPRLAAELYGLNILAKDVEDEDHNTTRFVVLSREDKRAPANNGPVITTFIFEVRNIPAALYKALGGFATNRINMTKLESYMIEGNFHATQFYADVEGHPEDPDLKLALEELDFFSDKLKILGVYPEHPIRDTFKERIRRKQSARQK